MNKILKITSYIVLITFLFSQIAFADTIYFYHTDPAGTPIAMTDASGSVVWKADYKPFGEEWSITSNIENNKRFVGKEKDTETGLNYFGARYMSSNIGRFISTDAVGPVNPAGKINQTILNNPQRLNLYSYGLNNPYKYVDNDGQWSEDVHSGIGRTDYGTYKWAKDIGFDDSTAKIVAKGNNAVDAGPGTHWMPFMLGGDQSRHFNTAIVFDGDTRDFWSEFTLQKAIEYAKAGNYRAAYGYLGKGLHSLQDKFAHRDWDPGVSGTKAHPDWYDDWEEPRNKEAAINTEKATKNYFKRFKEALKSSGL